VGVVGNRSSGKSSLVLSQLVGLKREVDVPVFVFGVEPSLEDYLSDQGIVFLHNREDILDLKIKNAVIYVDEVSDFVSTRTRDKQVDRFKRFINRIEHNNCFFVLSTAEVGFWNKLACSLINCFVVKEVDFDSLVNGTWLKRVVLGFPRVSDYRLDVEVNKFFVVSSNGLSEKRWFKYNPCLDSKKGNVNPFCDVKGDEKSDEKGDGE
jgi:hypothetical protein